MICKKTKSLLLISFLIVTLLLVSACHQKEETPAVPEEKLTDKIEKKLEAYRTDLMDSSEAMQSNDSIREYLINWAKSKGIDYQTDDDGIIFMKKKASTEYKEATPTVIICPYDSEQFTEYHNPAALALYTIKNNENTGPLTVAFVPEKGHDFSGIRKWKSSYIKKNSNIICLNAGVQGLFATRSGGGCTYRFTQSIKRTKPSFNKAYRISIDGLPGGQPDSKIDSSINPISFLRALLANMKNRNIQYEIGSFKSGKYSSLMPTSASVTVTIDPDHEADFLDRLDKAAAEFAELCGDDYPAALLTYEETDIPDKVIRSKDCNKFVSFMYTLLDGVYYRDEEGSLVSINAITSVRTKKKSIVVTSTACSLDPANLKEIDTGEETLCTLSDVKYEKIMETPAWEGEEDSDFQKAIRKAYRKATGKDLTLTSSVSPTSAGFLNDLPEGCSIICISLNNNIVQESTATMIQYLIDNIPTDESE